MGDKVVILGAGVAGLTAAHELAERGFEVEVYEHRGTVGGKARSFTLPDGRKAEHGFRFFPGFYRHLHHTMRHIPYQGKRRGVRSNLKSTRVVQVLQEDARPVNLPTRLWRWDTTILHNIQVGGRRRFVASFGLSQQDLRLLVRRLWTLLGACPERRFAEYETQGWLEFSGAENLGGQYQKMIAALTRSLVAAHADELSVRTGGYILLQLQLATLRMRGHLPRVLTGPTSDVWLEPWREYLESLGVRFHFQRTVKEIQFADGQIQGVLVTDADGGQDQVQAPWYVAALPFEIMRDLVTPEMIEADQSLGGLQRLEHRWMNGVMFYLSETENLVKGHTIYIDSAWALTSISQQQFWNWPDLGSVNGRKVKDILSVDVSDWETAGTCIHKKPASSCTKEEIIEEVLAQIRAHLKQTGNPEALDGDKVIGSFVDDDIQSNPIPSDTKEVNAEPLLINTVNSWANRPRARTGIKNLFLASDYVRTYTDLATMEGANEAARRAVNGILDASGWKTKDVSGLKQKKECKTWPLRYPGWLFTWLRYWDRKGYKRTCPDPFALGAELIAELKER